MTCVDVTSTTEEITSDYSRSNSNNSNQESSLNDYILRSSSASTVIVQDYSTEDNLFDDSDDASDYYAQFSCPEGSDDDVGYFHDDDENDDLFVHDHLNRKQMTLLDQLEEKKYQRSKRSHKKINAQCQIKTKHAKSIKTNSHNKQLYMHHRLFKQVRLDPPSRHDMPSSSSVPGYSREALRTIGKENQQPSLSAKHNSNKPSRTVPANPPNQFREYTINEQTIPNEPAFDDVMISFLLEMQNRDLSPNDYEMLLRLDERVQRKTVDRNVLETLPTVNVNETHLNDQCTICMEVYVLGQQMKRLPCAHLFHLHCIETYLKEFSTQCPLDNLPLI